MIISVYTLFSFAFYCTCFKLFIMLYLMLFYIYILNTVIADSFNLAFTETIFRVNKSQGYHNIIQPEEVFVISQDFQVVSKTDKTYIRTNRVLIDFGLGCQNTTIETISQLNRNKTENDLFRWMESIALVQRGQCPWSEKLAHIQALAIPQQWNTTAILLYDNETHPEITVNTSLYQPGTSFPTYSAALPLNRSVVSMADNDLRHSSLLVYFAPATYGQSLQTRIRIMDSTQQNNVSAYYSLTPFFDTYTKSGDTFGPTRNYLIYIIPFGGGFLIVAILFSWYKAKRMRAHHAAELAIHHSIYLQSRGNQVDPLPVDIVNSLPIEVYYPRLAKNASCVVCLEDFVSEKTDVRLLPCGHGFCVLCIDPWLTQKSTLCPICKWDCLPTSKRRESPINEHEVRQGSSLPVPYTLTPILTAISNPSSSSESTAPESTMVESRIKP
ncbi:hypothetical protein BY458DRAFT_527471 [Sporodiniella umbellata]|nr:hypothetical protein BY458DRAFT_527471 [Sporodiniella umbellata]